MNYTQGLSDNRFSTSNTKKSNTNRQASGVTVGGMKRMAGTIKNNIGRLLSEIKKQDEAFFASSVSNKVIAGADIVLMIICAAAAVTVKYAIASVLFWMAAAALALMIVELMLVNRQ